MADDTNFGIDPSDEYGNAQGKLAAEKIRKQQRLTDLLQNHLNKSDSVSPTQAFAASALALLPVIVGKHYAGTSGAALGAQAGGAGAGGYLSGLGREANNKKNVALLEVEQAQKELDALNNQDARLERAKLYKQGQEELQQDRFNKQIILNQQKRSQANAPSFQDSLSQSWFQKKVNGQAPTKEEEEAAIKNFALYDKGVQRANERQRIQGERVAPASKETKEAIRSSLIGINRLDNFLSKMDQIDPNLVSRPIAQVFKDTEQAAIKQDLDFYAGILQQANERGIMTNPDYDRYKGYFSIGPTDSPRSVARRLKEFKKTLEDRMNIFLQVAGAGGENITGLEELVNKSVASVFSGESTRGSSREEQLKALEEKYFQEELAKLKAGG